jgi:cell volume regulation protein A
MSEYILIGAGFLLLSVLASKVSDRFGIPALLLFLILGMLAGSDGPGGIYFDDPALAQFIGVVALALILFSGGLDTEWERVRPILKEGLIAREKDFMMPTGGTVVQSGDTLLVLADRQTFGEVQAALRLSL